jgi:nucleotidyltransferase substrate binding protein (TIGR01987 family)
MKKSDIKIKKLQNALQSLENIYQKPLMYDRVNVDATIQRFEFTFELCWKFLKDYFLERNIILHYPKDVIQQAFAVGLIDDEKSWIGMLRDRNMTSHTYDQSLADEIYGRIQDYVPEFQKLMTNILK